MQAPLDATPAALYARVSSDRQDVDLSVAAHSQSADFTVTASWGRLGDRQAFMPSQGEIERQGNTVDLCQNDPAHRRDVPAEVWESRLGRYKALKRRLCCPESQAFGAGDTG